MAAMGANEDFTVVPAISTPQYQEEKATPDWQAKLENWAFNAMGQITAGAVYKHTGLNTIPANQNTTAAVIDKNTGMPIPAGAEVLKQTGRTVQDVLQMNTTTIAIMAVGAAFFAWVLLKK